MELQYLMLVILIAAARKSVEALQCYACGFSSVDSDQSCLTITNTTFKVDCPSTYCTIYRQEFRDPPDVIASFARGCEETPDFLNHEVLDASFRTIYRACTNDLCNIGNGIESVVGGGLSPTPQYNGTNLLVPGTGGGAALSSSSITILVFSVVTLIVKID